MPKLINKERFEDIDDELGYSYVGYYFKIQSGNTLFRLAKYDDESSILITEPMVVNIELADTLALLIYIRTELYDEGIEILYLGDEGYEPVPSIY